MPFHFNLSLFRIALYALLGLFSFILFCLSAARLHETSRNGGAYDPIVVELLITALITIPWCIFVTVCIHKRIENKFIFTFRGELVGLGVLWLFWIIGAAIVSDTWGTIAWCQQYQTCRVLSALMAFAWLGWIVITVIIAVCMLFTFANKAFRDPFHGRWDPRLSTYDAGNHT